MSKKMNNKGFTLAELLVVVAIIAVLVAISIPVFTSQLEKAKEATDLANVRSAYSQAATDALTSATGEASVDSVPMTQAKSGWDHSDGKVGGTTVVPAVVKGDIVTVTVKVDGTITVAKKAS